MPFSTVGARIAPALPLVACLWLATPSIAAAQSADLQLEHHGVSIEGTTVTIGEGDTYTHQTYLALDHTVAPGTWVRTTMQAPSGLSVSDFDERSDENKLNQGARETFIFTANQDDDCSDSSQTITYTVRDMSSNANPVYTSSASFQLTVEDDDLCADDAAITPDPTPDPVPEGVIGATFAEVPDEHRGSVFTFQAHFSEAPWNSTAMVRQHAFEVEGGAVAKTVRLMGGQSRNWLVFVRPAGLGGVSVRLRHTADCRAEDSVCTASGKPLQANRGFTVPGPASAVNTAPTGLPTISGTVRVGRTLTASVDGIGDADGLTGAAFAYQWLSHDGTTETEIAGATASTCTLTGPEEDRTIRVRVTFTDDGGTEETLESAPTAAVAGVVRVPEDALTARLERSPAWHGGMAFWTELHFNEAPGLGYRDVRDRVFEVSGGHIVRAQRIERGSNRSWRLQVVPDGFGDIALTLPATEDCEADGAVCTPDGDRLETPVSAKVPGPGDRLAARLTGHGTPHETAPFELELHFSHAPNQGYQDVRDRMFAVTGGRIARAKRLVRGSNLGWRLTVAPEGPGAVGLELPATENCEAEDAVCTNDGRRLERGIAVTVAGPTAFSVSEAQADEGAGAALAFEVSLSRRLRAGGRVDVATRDGTATAGADYGAVTRTLVFAPGETVKTVEVPVLDDAHDEGSETMTLVLSNAEGAPIADAEGTGTIVNTDAIPQAWLARFGRTVTGQVLDAVEERLAAPREAGMRATLAGQALPSWTGEAAAGRGSAGLGSGTVAANDDTGTGEGVAGSAPGGTAPAGAESEPDLSAMAALRDWMAHADRGAVRFGSGGGFGMEGGRIKSDPGYRTRTVSGSELLPGTSFALTAGPAEDGGHASLWGRVSVAGFDGREDALALDGQVTTGLLGADWAAERWTAGLALGHSVGTGGYRRGDCDEDGARAGGCGGEIEAALTGLYPYAGLVLSERISAWLAGGHGAGALTVIPDGSDAIETDLSMRMGAGGTRIAVLEPEGGEGLRLALKGDGRFTRTSSDAARGPDGGNLAGAEADVWLLRVGLEGLRRFALGAGGDGASLTPSFELGVRRDGGDAETGFGADMGGGVAIAAPERGLRLGLRGRALVAHEASGFREWGASVGFGFDPRPETDRGLSMSLRQSWGASPSGGMDGLLDHDTLAGLAANDNGGSGFEASSRLSGELGYGVAMFGGGFTGTPNLGYGISSGGARDWRLGWRLTSAVRGDPGFEVNLDARRRDSAHANAEHGVALKALIRW